MEVLKPWENPRGVVERNTRNGKTISYCCSPSVYSEIWLVSLAFIFKWLSHLVCHKLPLLRLEQSQAPLGPDKQPRAPGRNNQLLIASKRPLQNSKEIASPPFPSPRSCCVGAHAGGTALNVHTVPSMKCEAKEKVNRPLVIYFFLKKETSINSCIYWSRFLIRKHGARN